MGAYLDSNNYLKRSDLEKYISNVGRTSTWYSEESKSVPLLGNGDEAFEGTQILNQEDILFLLQQGDLTGLSETNLCWRATTHGQSGSTFHSRCNQKGATITVVETTNGHFFGGYTNMEWQSSNTYRSNQQDSYVAGGNSFLFYLRGGKASRRVLRLNGDNDHNEIFDYYSYGPTFGGAHDLYIPNNRLSNNGNANTGTTYMQLTYSTTSNQYMHDGSSFRCKDVE